MDATDTAAPETRYCGRSQALLYNTIRPHASLGYKPPAPEVFVPAFAAWPAYVDRLRRPTLAQPPTLN
jgi:putative transposase